MILLCFGLAFVGASARSAKERWKFRKVAGVRLSYICVFACFFFLLEQSSLTHVVSSSHRFIICHQRTK